MLSAWLRSMGVLGVNGTVATEWQRTCSIGSSRSRFARVDVFTDSCDSCFFVGAHTSKLCRTVLGGLHGCPTTCKKPNHTTTAGDAVKKACSLCSSKVADICVFSADQLSSAIQYVTSRRLFNILVIGTGGGITGPEFWVFDVMVGEDFFKWERESTEGRVRLVQRMFLEWDAKTNAAIFMRSQVRGLPKKIAELEALIKKRGNIWITRPGIQNGASLRREESHLIGEIRGLEASEKRGELDYFGRILLENKEKDLKKIRNELSAISGEDEAEKRSHVELDELRSLHAFMSQRLNYFQNHPLMKDSKTTGRNIM